MVAPAGVDRSPASPWLPLASRDLAEETLTTIARELKAHADHAPDQPGLLVGRAGLALFFLYYARFTGSPADRSYGESLAGDLFASLPDEVSFTFCSGLAGVAWLLRHAAAERLLQVDADGALRDIDDQLRACMAVEMRNGRFDYLHGALGCSLYLLDAVDRAHTRGALGSLVADLEGHAIERGAGVCWRNPLLESEGVPEGTISLGLSHGMPSIVNILARFVTHDIDARRSGALLERATRFVLDQETSDAGRDARYPSMIGMDGSRGSRLAWCYGDPGVAITLWQAGAVADRVEWREKAVSVLERSALRRAPDDTLVTDAGLCHGSAGLALIFARMFHRTGRDVFRDAALHWLHETLAMGRGGGAYAGYRADFGDNQADLATELSVLMGIAGIGLLLMALTSAIEPAWDRALLLS